jgi:uncharacterized membrane protein YdbT with pleckstrin-like domain
MRMKVGAAADGPAGRPSSAYALAVSFKLSPGEQVIFEGHPSWRAILGFYIKGLIATAVIAALLALVSGDTSLVVIVALVGAGLTILAGFVKRVSTTYTITNRRLHIKRGIVSREVQETRLERVQNVNYDQSVFQRVMQIGDVDFDTAAGDDYNFIFSGVAEPDEVVHRVGEATRKGAQHAGLGDEEPAAPQQPSGGVPPA